jgi:cation diffusion facilitator family transporter
LFITIKIRHRAATLALTATVGLTFLKLGTAIHSNSVGVLSEGIHSFLDLISAAVSFFTVKEAGKPADAGHPFGHGKIETVSSLFESLLLVFAGALILYEGIDRLYHPSPLQHEDLAIAVIVISMVISHFVFLNNRKAAGIAESSALHVNALHFLADVLTSAAVLVGLVLMKLTGWLIIDTIIAFSVAIYIFLISLKQVKRALLELIDTQLPESEIKTIRNLVNSFKGAMIEAHDFRTRKSGATRHIDFHLVVCGEMSVNESHHLCDQTESKITEVFPRASIQIHVEPCEREKTHCHLTCPIHQSKKKES